jgi:Flagellar biosynthesis/type III secretory pathway lipoprotein
VALTDEEITRITNLVREAVGYNADRGDSINVANSAFAGELVEPVLPVWKDPDMIELGKQGLNWLLVLLVVLFAYFGVIRPLLRTVVPPKEKAKAGAEAAAGEEAEGEEGEEGVRVTLSGEEEGESFDERLERARNLARNDPKMVANLIKDGWA